MERFSPSFYTGSSFQPHSLFAADLVQPASDLYSTLSTFDISFILTVFIVKKLQRFVPMLQLDRQMLT